MALGQQLHEARLARKETASQIAAATRMKVQIVEALETEEFSKIPAPIYGRGFIKLYAEHVGLDPQPMIQEYMERFVTRAAPSFETVTESIVTTVPDPDPEEEAAKPKKPAGKTSKESSPPDLFSQAGIVADSPTSDDGAEKEDMPGLFDREHSPAVERGPLPAPPPSEHRQTDRNEMVRPPEKDTRPERLVDGPLDQMAKETRSALLIDLTPVKKALEKAGRAVLDKLERLGEAGAKKLGNFREVLKETRFDPSKFTYSKSPVKFVSLMIGMIILLIFIISGLSRCFGTWETEEIPTAGNENVDLHIAVEPPAPYFD